MAEPPHKRARRPDSKQMWDEADRRALLPSRERDEPRRERRDDRDRDRNRRYRSRSPRDSRGGDRDRDRRRDDRDARGPGRGRDNRDVNGRREDDRDRARDKDRGKFLPAVFSGDLMFRQRSNGVSQDGGREKPRLRSRERERERDSGRRVTRSRSPRRERDRDERIDGARDKHAEHEVEKEKEDTTALEIDNEPLKSRTATPPVSFKVGTVPAAQDHDRMDVDPEQKSKGKGKKGKGKKKSVEDDDDELVVEDSGLAALQAMMGFGGFGTTQNKKVAGNDISAVRKEKKTEYRQYMNRVGGFNRPLSPSRET
ncbi:U4/U6.U5 tri-snRNP-associated protein 3-like protein [Lachnellula subtilissima]|uniref:U4/U6.U5 tri-snRNP-associated protein 3-like protein n=1 Tax=Lachnellula subtilissima TaxID=602034 RepID=A0A8H8U5E9_9HELO|nr:U4/U6.U5 tri-snRNP-associated protein 3-like protein [Lachnellula subtilissima]